MRDLAYHDRHLSVAAFARVYLFFRKQRTVKVLDRHLSASGSRNTYLLANRNGAGRLNNAVTKAISEGLLDTLKLLRSWVDDGLSLSEH